VLDKNCGHVYVETERKDAWNVEHPGSLYPAVPYKLAIVELNQLFAISIYGV